MPRPSARLVEAQLIPTNALVASAMLFEGSKAQSVFRPHAAWQMEAWRQYSITPELSFAAGWIGNALSRCLLEPGETGPNGTSIPSDDAQTAQALGEFFGGDHGQAQMLQALGIHLTVAGEAYIVGRTVAGTKVWSIASVIEMTVAGNTWTINYGAGLAPVVLGDSDTVIRVWRPHPVRSMEAWSPVLTLIPTLTEIEMLTRHIFAQATSRVAGAGVWVVPSELEFPGSTATDNKAEGLQKLLGSTMSLSLDDPGNASSLVPIIVTAPGAMITDIKDGLIHFWSPFDEAAVNTRATAISRFCVGMDLPPEVIQGFSSRTSSTGGGASTVSHWCMSDDHQVLTRRGWVGPDEIKIGDLAYTLDNATGIARWEPVTDLYVAEADEKMLRISGRYHDSLTTMNHSWPVVDTRTGQRLTIKGHDLLASVQTGGPASRGQSRYAMQRGAPFDLPTQAKYSDEAVELVAWLITEGGLRYRPGSDMPHQVSIHQSRTANPDNCARIRRALIASYGPERTFGKIGRPTTAEEAVAWWRETVAGDMSRFVLSKAAWSELVAHCPHRIVSQDFIESLTQAQLELFLTTVIDGDGHRMGGKTPIYVQKNPRAIDGIELAAIRAGYAVNRYHATHQGFKEHTSHYMTWTKRREFRPARHNVTVEQYQGRVWCPTVAPTHTVLARRGEESSPFWTGQTSWMIEESAIKLHIEPLLELIANAVVIGYMRPVTKNPKASLVTNTNTLKLQPDRSKEALELADRGKIKDEALLLYSGMMPEDAMTDEGYKRWLLGKMAGASATPEQLAFAFKALGIPNVPDSVGEQPVHPGSNQGDSPSLLEHPSGQGPPDQPFSRQQMLLAVSEPMVLRALERVGNRLRNDGIKPPGVPAREVYLTAKVNGNATEYLSGAWEYVSTCSSGLAESEDLKRVLNAYVENLLTQQVPHDREALGRYLTLIDGK